MSEPSGVFVRNNILVFKFPKGPPKQPQRTVLSWLRKNGYVPCPWERWRHWKGWWAKYYRNTKAKDENTRNVLVTACVATGCWSVEILVRHGGEQIGCRGTGRWEEFIED
jgi:hypothetical protein